MLLEVNQGHQTWYHSKIRYVFLLLVCYSYYVRKTHLFSDIRLQICRDLETGLRVRENVTIQYSAYDFL